MDGTNAARVLFAVVVVFAAAAAPGAAGCRRRAATADAPRRARGAGAHMDHDPRHGGMLLMSGDNHAEIVVEPSGRVLVYVSDESRVEANPAEVSGAVVRRERGGARTRIPLRADASRGALVADGPPPTARYTDYDLELTWRGARIEGGVQVVPGGTAATMAAAAAATGGAGDAGHGGAHAHAAPHGGEVANLADGHVEARMTREGRITVWLLDAAMAPRTARGASATVRLAVPGAVDVPLAYDAAADALVVQVPPPAGEHVAAVIAVTPPGAAAPSQARVVFHLEPGGHGDAGS